MKRRSRRSNKKSTKTNLSLMDQRSKKCWMTSVSAKKNLWMMTMPKIWKNNHPFLVFLFVLFVVCCCYHLFTVYAYEKASNEFYFCSPSSNHLSYSYSTQYLQRSIIYGHFNIFLVFSWSSYGSVDALSRTAYFLSQNYSRSSDLHYFPLVRQNGMFFM